MILLPQMDVVISRIHIAWMPLSRIPSPGCPYPRYPYPGSHIQDPISYPGSHLPDAYTQDCRPGSRERKYSNTFHIQVLIDTEIIAHARQKNPVSTMSTIIKTLIRHDAKQVFAENCEEIHADCRDHSPKHFELRFPS